MLRCALNLVFALSQFANFSDSLGILVLASTAMAGVATIDSSFFSINGQCTTQRFFLIIIFVYCYIFFDRSVGNH